MSYYPRLRVNLVQRKCEGGFEGCLLGLRCHVLGLTLWGQDKEQANGKAKTNDWQKSQNRLRMRTAGNKVQSD